MVQRALVVDDDAEIAHFVQKVLQSRGLLVSLAPNGREALRLVSSEVPDMIFLDIMMPGMDGATVLAELRRRPALNATRVVMLTAKGQPRAAIESHRIGADAYVTKPFTIQELLSSVGLR